MTTYNVTSDIADERQVHLSFLHIGTLGVALVATGLTLTSGQPVVPWLWMMATLGASYLLRNKATNLAAWIFMIGLIGLPALMATFQTQVNLAYVMIYVPIALAGLLVETHIGLVTGLTLLVMWGVTILQVGIAVAFGILFAPSIIAVILAVVMFVAFEKNMGLVDWAVDSQKKNAERAEVYYAQREQLKETMLEVQHGKARLELMNVQLEEAQGKAERANNAKSVFLSNMSHELRTPLNVIIGYTSSMLNMPEMYNYVPLDDIYRGDIELIRDNGQYLLGLINDILDLSKIEAGKLELHSVSVNLLDLFQGTIATSIGLLKDKPVQIIPDYPSSLPTVWADPMRVRQIILNLMSNAIKFTETGSVTLSAHLEGDWVKVSITDTGIGIPKEALPVIFDRFKQAQHDTDKHYGGTGLGLDISQQLSRMHGGQLTVESEVGVGSTFSFTLPLATAEQLRAIRPSAATSVTGVRVFEAATPVESNVATILVVEDDAHLRSQLRQRFEQMGYLVVDTHFGTQAIELASGLLPSLIVLDIPADGDLEIIQALKVDPEIAGIPLLLCADERYTALASEWHLRKPFTVEEVVTCVQELLSEPLTETRS